MKVLVLSCGIGGGHNSAARAIVEELKERNIEADFKEFLEIVNKKVSKVVNNLYIKSTSGKGTIFKKVYRLGELYDRTHFKSPVYKFNSLAKQRLYKFRTRAV